MATSRLSSAAPSALRRSSVAAFLFRHSESHGSESPHCVIVPNLRSASPTLGSSSLITSAPNSASCVAQNGPARKVDTSITRQPPSGVTSGSVVIVRCLGSRALHAERLADAALEDLGRAVELLIAGRERRHEAQHVLELA